MGADEQASSTEDVAYVSDLGLVAQDAAGTPRIANPIYAEVVPRHLNYAVQAPSTGGTPCRVDVSCACSINSRLSLLASAAPSDRREHDGSTREHESLTNRHLRCCGGGDKVKV